MQKTVSENNIYKYEIINSIVIGNLIAKSVDIELAMDLTRNRLNLQNGLPYPLLSNIKGIKNITKEARDFLASEEGCEGVIAAAVLIDSTIGSMIGNFFIRISKPLRPTRIFTEESEALKWLEQFKKS